MGSASSLPPAETIDDQLEFYKGSYRKMLENRLADGTLEKRFAQGSALMKSGAAPEDIEAFAYDLCWRHLKAFSIKLDDHQGRRLVMFFLRRRFSKMWLCQTMEQGPEGEATGRYLFEVHGRFLFLICRDRDASSFFK